MTNPFPLKMAGFQVPTSGRFYPTSHDARYSNAVIVHYPLHPFYGRGKLPVFRRRGVGNVQNVEVILDSTPQAVPLWMTDESFCQRLKVSLKPQCSLASLLELLSLLRAEEL
jgi:hypothetical protein